MIKQILPNLHIEYEVYCEECPNKAFNNIDSFVGGVTTTQYIRCENAKICQSLFKYLNLQNEKSV